MMEKLIVEREVGLIDCGRYDFEPLIDSIAKLKSFGATEIIITEHGILGVKREAETDREYNSRINEERNYKLRVEQAELVELARLKEKYEKKQ